MELSIYDVIKKIIITPKSLLLKKKLGKVTFEVHTSSNKIMIRNAVEKIWNVKVLDVRVINRAGKKKRIARKSFTLSDTKKAIVSLKAGYSIDLPDYVETMGLSSQASVANEGAR